MSDNMLREKIADLITEELYERFSSPSSAVIGVQLADRIIALLREHSLRGFVDVGVGESASPPA